PCTVVVERQPGWGRLRFAGGCWRGCGRLGTEVAESVLIRPRLHPLGERLGRRIERFVARHHARQVVEHVTLHHLSARPRADQATPVDVVLLCEASSQRGDVRFTHGFPPNVPSRLWHRRARLREAAISPVSSSTTSIRSDSPPPPRVPTAVNPTRTEPERRRARRPQAAQGCHAWKKTPSM